MVHFDLARSLGLDPAEYDRFMEAAHEDDFLLGLPPSPGAAEAVAAWHRAGARISVVTGRPPESRAVTARWLARSGMPFDHLEVVDKYGRYSGPRAVSRSALVGRDYALVVEDSVEMAEHLLEHTRAFVLLVDRPWNRASDIDHGRLRRVHDWKAIAEHAAGRLGPVLERRGS
jgi:uncharacterized HAD superfamily protein